MNELVGAVHGFIRQATARGRLARLCLALCLMALPSAGLHAQSGAFAGPGDQPNAFGAPRLPPSEPAPPAYSPPAYQPPAYQPPAPAPRPSAGQPDQHPQVPHAAPGAQQYLVSLWHGQATDDTGSWDVYVTFRPDGTFVQRQTLSGTQFHLASSGHYSAQFISNGGVIMFNPQQWSPPQFCPNANTCRPVTLPSVLTIKFKVIGQDIVQTDGGLFQRIGPAR